MHRRDTHQPSTVGILFVLREGAGDQINRPVIREKEDQVVVTQLELEARSCSSAQNKGEGVYRVVVDAGECGGATSEGFDDEQERIDAIS